MPDAVIKSGQNGREQSIMERDPQRRPLAPTREATVPLSVSSWLMSSTVDGGRMALWKKVTAP